MESPIGVYYSSEEAKTAFSEQFLGTQAPRIQDPPNVHLDLNSQPDYLED